MPATDQTLSTRTITLYGVGVALLLASIALFLLLGNADDAARARQAALAFACVAVAASAFAAWLGSLVVRMHRDVDVALAAAHTAAEQAGRVKAGFLATAGHDLRQPLHAINLFLAVLRRRVSGEQAIDIVDKIGSAAQMMQRMFNTVLEISKLDAGVITPMPRAFALSDIVQRLRAEFTGIAAEKGVRLSLPAGEFGVHTDPVLLETILRNLLSNAINFTAAGQVSIHAWRQDGQLQIEITDTGPGMDAAQLAHAFDEFWRGETMAGSERGLGLGLPIVQRIANLLGLAIGMTSQVGRGTRVYFAVPLATLAAAIAEPAKPQVATQLTGKVVLVADDDALVRAAVAQEIADWQATVIVTRDGDDAIAKFRAIDRGPDLLIVDYDLGSGLNGLQLIERLNKLGGRRIPAIIVSGSTDEVSLRRFRNAGCLCLTKPVDPAGLRAASLQLLG
jgi:signal transduction histidine kinase